MDELTHARTLTALWRHHQIPRGELTPEERFLVQDFLAREFLDRLKPTPVNKDAA